VGIIFSRISSSYWIDNLGFLLREKLAAIFITPCSWGFRLADHLLHQLHANKFSGTIHHRAGTWVTTPEDFLCVVNDQPVGNPKRKV
jgi:hypothetical protein